jgi:hypothetical protein
MQGLGMKKAERVNEIRAHNPSNTNLEQLHAVENPVDELIILRPIGQEFAIVDWRPFEKGATLRKREALWREMSA